jgi:hypothetical protein
MFDSRPRLLRPVRRRITRALAAVILLAAPCRGLAQAPAARPGPEVEQWIVQLASDDWRARQRATDRLVALGDDALPRLTNLVDATTDSEVRTRAQAAIRQIEDNRLTGTTLVTLDLDNVPAAEAFAQLARQARAPLASDPIDLLRKIGKPVSLHARRRPFWQVMQELSLQTDLEVTGVTRHNREIGLGVTRGGTDWMDKPITLAGPLLIRADRLSRVASVELKPPRDASEEFAISLTVFAEPKLKVLDFSQTIRLDEALDERGNSLVPPEDPNALAFNAEVFGSHGEGHTSRWEVGATLHHPKGMGSRIARLRGATTLMVETRSAALDVPLAGARGATRTLGGLRVTVKSADARQAELTVFRDGRGDPEWAAVRMQLSAGQAQLLDDRGQVVARSTGGGGGEADESPDNQRIDLRLRFARESDGGGGGAETPAEGKRKPVTAAAPSPSPSSPDPVRLVWEIPVEARELVVPFEFRDLPIP